MVFDAGSVVSSAKLNTLQFTTGLQTMIAKTNIASSKIGMKLAAIAVPAAIVGVAILAIGTASIKAADTVEKSYNIIKIGTGETGKTLKGLEDQFKRIGSRVPEELEEVATAIADVNTRLGLTGVLAGDVAEQFLNLARISKVDVGSSIRAASRLFEDFGIAQEEQAETLDKLFVLSQKTGIDPVVLATKTTQYGTSLRALGYNLEDSIALVAKWEKEGVNAGVILGSMKIAVGKMVETNVDNADAQGTINSYYKKQQQIVKDTTAEIAELDFEIKYSTKTSEEHADAISRRTKLEEKLSRATSTISKIEEENTRKTKESTEAQIDLSESFQHTLDLIKNAPSIDEAMVYAKDVFGARAMADATMAIREGRFEIDDYTEAMADVQGIINDTAQDTLTLGDKMEVLGNKLTIALEPIGTILLTGLTGVIDKIIEFDEEYKTRVQDTIEGTGRDLEGGNKRTINAQEKFNTVFTTIWDKLWNYTVDKQAASTLKMYDVFGIMTSTIDGDAKGLAENLKYYFVDSIAESLAIFGMDSIDVEDTIVGVFSRIGDTISSFTDTLKIRFDDAASYFDGLRTGIIDVINGIISAMNDFISGYNSLSFELPTIAGFGGDIIGVPQIGYLSLVPQEGFLSSPTPIGGSNGAPSGGDSSSGTQRKTIEELLSNVPALASGGIVSSPTLALIGEGSETEVVLPLSKLQSVMQPSYSDNSNSAFATATGSLETIISEFDTTKTTQIATKTTEGDVTINVEMHNVVRNDRDIGLISRELAKLSRRQSRQRGVST